MVGAQNRTAYFLWKELGQRQVLRVYRRSSRLGEKAPVSTVVLQMLEHCQWVDCSDTTDAYQVQM